MRYWIILVSLCIAVGTLIAQGPGMGGGRGGHGGPQLIDEERTAMTALRDSLLSVSSTREEIHTAMDDLLASWGFEPLQHPRGRSGQGGSRLTDEQHMEMTALRDSLLAAGAAPEEMHQAMAELLTSWGHEPGIGRHRGSAGKLDLSEDQRIQLHDLVYRMRETGASRSEIRAAVRDLLTEWGIQPHRHQNSGRTRQDRPFKQRRIAQAFNQPNPFNPSTRIGYNLTEASSVSIAIYDLQGRLIHNYMQGYQPVGLYAVVWDGTLASGQPAPSGVYFYRITAGNEVTTQRMLLMK